MAQQNGKGTDPPRAPDGTELIPQEHGGALRPGGKPGNKGGPGRPPDQVRTKVRELGWLVLVDMLEGYHLARNELPGRSELEQLEPDELVELLDEIRVWVTIPWKERRQILDTALKYGIGTKHVHAADDEDGSRAVGIVMMPALEDNSGALFATCPNCGYRAGGAEPETIDAEVLEDE